MRSVLVALSAVFACMLVFAPAQSAPSAPTSHIQQSWSKTICCQKEKKGFWSTERQCRLAQGEEAKPKVCHDTDAKTKACCKKEAKTWWSNRRDCRRTGIVVHETQCGKPKA